MSHPVSTRRAALVGMTSALLVFCWQFLTVHYNYHGDWSGLFDTGEKMTVPPIVAAEHPYRFSAVGWDGQFYHAIAHDPFLQRGSARYIEAAGLRYRRILIPLMAYLVAGGNDALVDRTYHSIILLAFAVGAWWLSSLMQAAGKPAVAGLAFLVLPGSIASLDRQAIDAGLLCFCCGFALYTRYTRNSRALYLVLLGAGLVRDTGLLLTAAYCLWLVLRREVRRAMIFATAAVPTIAWYLFVSRRTTPYGGGVVVWWPFSGVLHRLMHPMNYVGSGLKVELIRGLDFLAAAGALVAMILTFRYIRRGRRDPVDMAIVLFALLGIFVWRPGDWLEALDYGRILSPLLFFEALAWIEGATAFALAPLCMMLPRFGVEMGAQVIGVIKGVLAV